jgi:dUTP pyrophosphatase
MKKHIEMNVKKLVPEAVVPRYAKDGDAGLDLVATSMTETDMYIEYGTGLAFEIPRGYVGLIYPRSSLSNYDLVLANHVGVVDSGYRGELKFRFKKTKEESLNPFYRFKCKVYQVGDKIGQLIVMPYPLVVLNEVDELEETDRGATGFGSSGR